jgi:MSHA biogenesis protein MshQ
MALEASQTVSTELTSGIHHATSLTTTAGITLTFKGSISSAEDWLINVDTFINFGANLTIPY